MGTREAGHVLLAGTEVTFSRVMEKALRQEGYVCDCASNAKEAVAALEAHSYDLLIADIDMPGNRQLEIIRACQGDGYSVPVIVVTGSPSVSTAVQSLHLAVVVEYLIKPIEPAEILHCVEPAVATGRFWRATFKVYDQTLAPVGDTDGLAETAASAGQQQTEAGVTWTLENYLEQTSSYIIEFAANLKGTLDAMRRGCNRQTTIDMCASLNCPRLVAYEESLRDTIAVLRKTKAAFAAKDLWALRERLEALLTKPKSA